MQIDTALINLDRVQEMATTKEEYIAAQFVLCIDQTGEIPTMEELIAIYTEGLDELFKYKFGTISKAELYTILMNIFKVAVTANYWWVTKH